MLRITRIEASDVHVTLKLEGQLVSDWVTELERECQRTLAQHQRVRLDLQDVTSVDRRAARMVAALPADSVVLVNCPPIVRELLERPGPT